MTDIEIFDKRIQEAERIVITAHTSPDGDAVGSSLAVWHYLKNNGKMANVILPNRFPNFLNWMKGSDSVILFDENKEKAKQLAKEADMIIALDFNEPHRVAAFKEDFENSNAFKVLIDHHIGKPEWMDLNLSVVGASSTCELIFNTLFNLENESLDFLTKPIAECLYSGLMTDTGGFRFSTTSDVHKIAGHLLDAGVVPSEIDNLINNSFSIDRLKLFGYCTNEKMRLIPEKKLAYIMLSKDEILKFNVQKGDTEGLVNQPMKISDINVSILMKESDEKVKLSFRSKGNVNVADFVKNYFEGGGHLNAAGGVSYQTLKETEQKLLNTIQYLEV